MWWLFPTACLCGVGELIGWSGRLWSAYNVDASDPFMMQCVSQATPGTTLLPYLPDFQNLRDNHFPDAPHRSELHSSVSDSGVPGALLLADICALVCVVPLSSEGRSLMRFYFRYNRLRHLCEHYYLLVKYSKLIPTFKLRMSSLWSFKVPEVESQPAPPMVIVHNQRW
jgi:hypothetical protein